MEFAGISLFDLVVLAIVAIAGLIGLMTGFIRGGLFLASWIIAVIVAFLGLPAVEPFAAELVGPGLWATVAAGGGVFLVTLAALLVISHFVTKLVRDHGHHAAVVVDGARLLGASDTEIVETVALVGLHTFMNYLCSLAHTEADCCLETATKETP